MFGTQHQHIQNQNHDADFKARKDVDSALRLEYERVVLLINDLAKIGNLFNLIYVTCVHSPIRI